MAKVDSLDSRRNVLRQRLGQIERQIAEAEATIYDDTVHGPRLMKALGQRDRLTVEQDECQCEIARLDVEMRARNQAAPRLTPRFAHPIGDDGRAADGIHHITW